MSHLHTDICMADALWLVRLKMVLKYLHLDLSNGKKSYTILLACPWINAFLACEGSTPMSAILTEDGGVYDADCYHHLPPEFLLLHNTLPELRTLYEFQPTSSSPDFVL